MLLGPCKAFGVDLSVIDAINVYYGPVGCKGESSNFSVVGRDAVAVETVRVILIGLNPTKMPVIQKTANNSLGMGYFEK